MTAIKSGTTVELHCDGRIDKDTLCSSRVISTNVGGIRTARRGARYGGWSSHMGRDLCPNCDVVREGGYDGEFLSKRRAEILEGKQP